MGLFSYLGAVRALKQQIAFLLEDRNFWKERALALEHHRAKDVAYFQTVLRDERTRNLSREHYLLDRVLNSRGAAAIRQPANDALEPGKKTHGSELLEKLKTEEDSNREIRRQQHIEASIRGGATREEAEKYIKENPHEIDDPES